MNNKPVGKRDVANVLSKYIKFDPDDNVSCTGAKLRYIWRADFIADVIYKILRLEMEVRKTTSHIEMSGGCLGITIRA